MEDNTNKRIIRKLNKILTENTPVLEANEHIFSKPKAVDFWSININNEPGEKMIIYLRSDVGCSHGVKTGGCTGCKHWKLGTAGQKLNYDDMYIKQYQWAVNEYGVKPVVSIFNEGNLLNSEEIPHSQLLNIIQDLSIRGVKKLIIESRPEYIHESILKDIKNVSGAMEIEIGIGLESQNDFIRNELFLKEIELADYSNALSLISKVGLRSLMYIILKPAFLNESQAVRETIDSIKYAFSAGANVVSIEPLGVEPHTITELLYNEKLYELPKLWSVLKCINETYMLGEIRIGGYQYEPRPTIYPGNCDKCTEKFIQKIHEWNSNYDISSLNSISCSCYKDYEKMLSQLDSTIDENSLKLMLTDFLERHMGKKSI